MSFVILSPIDLGFAAILVLLLALLSWRMGLGLERSLVIAALRTTVQLLLIGLLLKFIFSRVDLLSTALVGLLMVLVASREVLARQKSRFRGWQGYAVGTASMFISSFLLLLITLSLIFTPTPWYQPQYSIPLLGILLGNILNGIALGLDQLLSSAWQQRQQIEGRLLLGETAQQSIRPLKREAVRIGMMPMINAMAAAGVVTIPGIMAGQIMAGVEPFEAVKYQILILFLLSAGTGFGTMLAIGAAGRMLFDGRERLRLDRLSRRK